MFSRLRVTELSKMGITCSTYVTGPEPNQGEGPCGGAARRSAAEPEAPASGADAPTRCYVTLRQFPMTKRNLSTISCEMLTTMLTPTSDGGIFVV
jgi:hypothetical protein